MDTNGADIGDSLRLGLPQHIGSLLVYVQCGPHQLHIYCLNQLGKLWGTTARCFHSERPYMEPEYGLIFFEHAPDLPFLLQHRTKHQHIVPCCPDDRIYRSVSTVYYVYFT